jgi:GNAT superfamily N-acetyltransferase
MKPRTYLPSSLLEKCWLVPDVGHLTISGVSQALLGRIDSSWPSNRLQGDYHHDWRWGQITKGKVEAFVLLRDSIEPVGIWCSARRSPIRLPDGRFYRLDHLEISPTLRGTGFGVFLVSVVAARALELHADGVVLGTWDALRGFYLELGAEERKPAGWNLAINLVPFTLQLAALQTLSGLIGKLENAQGSDLRGTSQACDQARRGDVADDDPGVE